MMNEVRETFSFLFSRMQGFFVLVLLDFLFVVILWGLSPVYTRFDGWLYVLRSRFQYWGWLLLYIIALVVILSLVSAVIASYKYLQLHYYRGMVSRFELFPGRFRRYGAFLALTIKVFVPLLFLLLLLTLYFMSLMRAKAAMVSHPLELAGHFFSILGLLVVVVLASVLFMGLVHVHFGKRRLLRSVVRTYGRACMVFWHDLKILFLGGICVVLVHLFFKVFIFSNMRLYLSSYGLYKQLVWVLGGVTVYLMLCFHRAFLFQRYSRNEL